MELIIDGHSHVTYPLETHIDEMNKNSVSKTVLFRTSIHPEYARNYEKMKQEMRTLNRLIGGDPTAAEAAAEQSKKELISAIELYPDRYVGFGFISPSISKEEAVQQMMEDIVAHNLVGLGEYTLAPGTVLQMNNLFYAAQVCGNLPIWIHAFNPLTFSDIRDIDSLAKEYSSVPVIIGHMGGSNWLDTISLVQNRTNLYMDISAFFSTLALEIAINTIPDKCIFGVDLPYGDLELSIRAVKKYAKSAYVRECVFSGNILSILS